MSETTHPNSNATTWAWVEIICGVVVAFLAWHVGLAWTTGMRMSQVGTTLDALKRFQPAAVAGNPASHWAPAAIVAVLLLLVYVAARVALGVWWRRRRQGPGRKRSKREGLSSARQMSKRVAGAKEAPTHVTASLVRLRGRGIGARAEDAGLILAPPRWLKSAAAAIPLVLDASGSVVSTSTKPDVLRATLRTREKAGPVWVLDLDNISGYPDKATFPFVAGCEDPKVARERAQAMSAAKPIDDGKAGSHFAEGVNAILRALLHAAALDGGTFRDVVKWSQDFDDETPAEILRELSPTPEWGTTLDQWMREDNPDTIGNTRTSLARVMDVFMDRSITEALSVEPGTPGAFDIDEFLSGPSTLYLLVNDEGSASVAPVVTAIVSSLVMEATKQSQHTRSGRLSTMLDLVLDECANICPLPMLPKLMSEGGGRHIRVWVFIQAHSQLVTRWGKDAAETIMSSASFKLVFGGLWDSDLLERISKLIGGHWVQSQSHSESSGASGPSGSTQWSERRDRWMYPEDIRKLAEGTALLMYRELDAVVELVPYWAREDADELKAGEASVLAASEVVG